MTLLLPVKRYHPDLYYRIEGQFFHWLLSLVAMWSYTAGYNGARPPFPKNKNVN